MDDQKHTGALYLIPIPITEGGFDTIPKQNIQILHRLRFFIAEKARSCRRYIKMTSPPYQISELHVTELPRENEELNLSTLLEPILQGHDMGFMSEAGCPGIADPGARIVQYCHLNGIRVIPLVGPSSIILALMASGLNGQKFTFHGYLPIKKDALRQKLQQLELRARKSKETQIFIETPYRNLKLIGEVINQLHHGTRFCIAAHINSEKEWIRTATIQQWRNMDLPDLHKVPAIFLLGTSV